MSEQAESSYHHGNLRDEILTRAAEIVGEDGIEALSLRRIARDLGVSHGAPNRHFKTKAELLAELGAEAWFGLVMLLRRWKRRGRITHRFV